MKREIKFRRPHYKYDGTFTGFSYWGPIEDGFVSPASYSGHDFKPDEQYTGLRDRNGVEIYEGDICSIKFIWNNGQTDYTHGKIIMDEYMWCIECVNGETYSINRVSSPGIIGNIHETPNLL